ncbi:MAG: MFS transporter [Patescibacteria group bacterium]
MIKKLSINKIVFFLIKADFFFFSALGLVAPIFAVFLTEKLKDGSIEVAGFAVAIYWITKSIFEIPIAKFLDKRRGEKDDLLFLVAGYFVVGLIHFGYTQATLSWHIYILEALYGIAMAIAMPGWSAMFTRHIDKGKEGFEWSIEHVAYSIGVGIAGALSGILVARYGFNVVFIIAGVVAIIGSLIPLFVYKDVNIGGDNKIRFLKP